MPITVHGVTTLLQIFDMPRSVAFYRDVLGFTIVSTSGPTPGTTRDDFHWAMLKLGDATLMLNTAYEDDERPATADPARVASHGDTTLYFACADVDEIYAHLRAKKCAVKEPQTAYYGMKQVYLKDPDGFELCFQHPAR